MGVESKGKARVRALPKSGVISDTQTSLSRAWNLGQTPRSTFFLVVGIAIILDYDNFVLSLVLLWKADPMTFTSQSLQPKRPRPASCSPELLQQPFLPQ